MMIGEEGRGKVRREGGRPHVLFDWTVSFFSCPPFFRGSSYVVYLSVGLVYAFGVFLV